jgi:glycerophosphoryl diester phosphodiesterase
METDVTNDSIFYNDGGRSAAGFKGNAGDCVARAISIAGGKPYAEVYKRLADGQASIGRRRSARNGVSTDAPWFKKYMSELGFEWVAAYSKHLSADELPPGHIICDVGRHYVAVIDRFMHDTGDSSRWGTRKVRGYWRQKGAIANDDTRQPSEHKKVVGRVKALLAKTLDNGCTEAETMAAMEKAAEIMAAHDIAEGDLQQKRDEHVVTRHTGNIDRFKVRWNLCSAVATFTHCRAWRQVYDKTIVLCGLESDTEFAEWLLGALADFVLREIESHLAERRRNGLPCSRTVSASFMYGMTRRISERLLELSAQWIPSTGKDVAVSPTARVEAFMKEEGIKVATVSSNYFAASHDCYAAGKAAGSRASFARPVSSGGPLRIGKA